MDTLRLAVNGGLVIASVILAILLWRLYRYLEDWYRTDPSRFWQVPERGQTLPVVGFAVLLGAALAGAMVFRLASPWGFIVTAAVLCSVWLFAYQPMSPRRHAFREIQKNPLRYPVPETSREAQGRMALIVLGGLALFLGAIAVFLVIFAASLSQ